MLRRAGQRIRSVRGMEATLKFLFKQRNKKGFTLIELIVVLVVMAILAAAAVPTMMGYIGKAKAASHYAEVRQIVLETKVVMQLVLSEYEVKNIPDYYLAYPSPPTELKPVDAKFKKLIKEKLEDIGIENQVSIFINFKNYSGEGYSETPTLFQVTFYLNEKKDGMYYGEYLRYEEGVWAANPGQIHYYDEKGNLID